MPRQQRQRLFQLASADPLLEAAMAGLVRRIFLRQFAPLRSRSQHPQHAVQHGTCVVPRTAAVILAPCRAAAPVRPRPTVRHSVPSVPSSTHAEIQSSPRMHKISPQVFMRLVLAHKREHKCKKPRNINHLQRYKRTGSVSVLIGMNVRELRPSSEAQMTFVMGDW